MNYKQFKKSALYLIRNSKYVVSWERGSALDSIYCGEVKRFASKFYTDLIKSIRDGEISKIDHVYSVYNFISCYDLPINDFFNVILEKKISIDPYLTKKLTSYAFKEQKRLYAKYLQHAKLKMSLYDKQIAKDYLTHVMCFIKHGEYIENDSERKLLVRSAIKAMSNLNILHVNHRYVEYLCFNFSDFETKTIRTVCELIVSHRSPRDLVNFLFRIKSVKLINKIVVAVLKTNKNFNINTIYHDLAAIRPEFKSLAIMA